MTLVNPFILGRIASYKSFNFPSTIGFERHHTGYKLVAILVRNDVLNSTKKKSRPHYGMKIKKHLSSKNIIIKSTTKVAINYQRNFIKKRKNLKILPYWEELLCKLFEKINLNCNLKKTRQTKRYISTK
ncbi:hypothetical protein B566_EDAN013978, partial [Ephemera danica]